MMGSPGSGKSTLLKYVIEERKATKNEVVASFFFHGRGLEIQKSSLGLFRSILHQILDQVPQLLSAFNSMFQRKAAVLGQYGEHWKWHEAELRDFLRNMSLQATELPQIRIYIDALDEGGEDVAQSLLSFFSQIASSDLHVCISCRYYPIIEPHGDLIVHVDEENHQDLKTYVRRQISHGAWGSKEAYQLRKEILATASGSFQWTVLVLRYLSKLKRTGRSFKEIMNRFRTLPPKLNDLYRELLMGISENDKSESLHLIQWVLFAMRPLSITELRYAMAINADSTCSSMSECRESLGFAETDSAMEKRVVNLSAGLIEVVRWSSASPDDVAGDEPETIVQFTHQSVVDYLHTTRIEDFCSFPRGDVNGWSHFRLSRSCIKQITMKEVVAEKNILRLSKLFPFVGYSLEYWIKHAKEVEAAGIPQRDILHLFSWPSKELISRWANFFNGPDAQPAYKETTLL